jgi:signal transduction histidine kinase
MRSRITPAWLATAALLAVFQVVGSFGAADNQSDRRAMDAVAVVLALVGPAAVALVARWPLLAAAAALGAADVFIGLGYPYGPVFISAIVCLFAAVQVAPGRATWVVAVAGFGGFVVAHALDARTRDVSLLGLAVVAGWLAVVVTVAEVVRTRREQAAERARAAEDERQRRLGEQRLGVAQELHDVLAHNISMINVQASVALHLIEDQPDRVGPALASIKEASREALHELRTALDVLRRGDQEDAAPLAPAPRLADLDRLVAGVEAGGIEVRLEHEPPPAPLPAAVELAAYRIVQEALTNVARHAQARRVVVRVGYADGVTVEVLDDGVGGPAVPGNGIRGMQERADSLGGTVSAGPRPGGGFRVAVHLPGDRA